MTESDWPASLADFELEELDQYLRAHPGDARLLLDGVHGLLTSLAIGPSPAMPDEWLPEILHEPFADAEEGERILTLLARLNDSVLLEIETGSYEPILGENMSNAWPGFRIPEAPWPTTGARTRPAPMSKSPAIPATHLRRRAAVAGAGCIKS